MLKLNTNIFLAMPEPTIHDLLRKTFSTSGKDEWVKAASTERPDKTAVENLLWNFDGLSFSPYYTKEDLKETEYLDRFHLTSFESPYPAWFNIPEIKVTNAGDDNQLALDYLLRGADGIIFDLSESKDISIDALLKNIDWNHCYISFKNCDTEVATKIFAYTEQKKYTVARLLGCIWWRQSPPVESFAQAFKNHLSEFQKYHLFGIEAPPQSPISEISTSLQRGVRLIEALTDLGLNRETVFRSVSFSFTSGGNFLVNIAKLKAVRILWYQISRAFEITEYMPSDLHIHCRTNENVDEKYEPHGNMIQNTVQALSAIAGGCNAITIKSGKQLGSMIDRVALNVSNVLKEESHFGKVANPLAGSYAIDKMVHDLSRAVWKDFQKNLQS